MIYGKHHRIYHCLCLALALCFGAAVLGQSEGEIDKLFARQQEVAKVWNTCFAELNKKQHISPHSPGYWTEFLDCWEGSGIEEKWRKLEETVREISLEQKKAK